MYYVYSISEEICFELYVLCMYTVFQKKYVLNFMYYAYNILEEKECGEKNEKMFEQG